MDERRHVHELDGRAARHRALAGSCRPRRAEEDEHGSQALAPGGQRFGPDLPDEAGVRPDRALEPRLEQLEVGVEPGSARTVASALIRPLLVAVCNATIPPPRRRQPIR